MKLKERIKRKSPKIFRKITNICLTLGAVGATILSLPLVPIALPASIISLGGYLVAVGAVGSSISKITVEDKSNLEDGDK